MLTWLRLVERNYYAIVELQHVECSAECSYGIIACMNIEESYFYGM